MNVPNKNDKINTFKKASEGSKNRVIEKDIIVVEETTEVITSKTTKLSLTEIIKDRIFDLSAPNVIIPKRIRRGSSKEKPRYITVYMPEDEYLAISQIAESHNMTVSNYTRAVLRNSK